MTSMVSQDVIQTQSSGVAHAGPPLWRDLQVRTTHSLHNACLDESWDSIVNINPSLTAFSSREWLASWWAAFGHDAPLSVLTCHSADQTVAIAPLFRTSASLFGKRISRLQLVGSGSGDSDGLDLVLRPGYEVASLNALLSSLDQQADWDVCSLETLAAHSPVCTLLPRELDNRGWRYRITRMPQWRVSLPSLWKDYVDGLSPDFRPLVTRYPKRLETRYHCTLERCQTEDELNHYLPVLFDLHQRRWLDAGRPGAFATSDRKQFFRSIASAFLKRGWLDFWVLSLNGSPVALQFCCRYGDAVYLLQEGFDPAYNKDRVGYALRAKVLQHYIQAGIKWYDFMGGSDPYKQRFGARETSYLTIDFARPRSMGALFLRSEELRVSTRSWLRTHLPERVVNSIRSRERRASSDAERRQGASTPAESGE